MPSDDHCGELEPLLKLIGVPAEEIDIKLIELDEIKQSFIWRCEHRAKSPRISAVVSQLRALADAAQRACSGCEVSIPDEIHPAAYDALTGRYPFSNIDVAPVTAETLEHPEVYGDIYRTAVVNAPVAPYVVNAAMRQLPDQPHLVAVRSMPFPFDAANVYFFGDPPQPQPVNIRQRLEDFIVYEPEVASAFLQRVQEGVRRATRDPARENPGRRTLYDWAEPMPAARLAFDVLDLLLEPAAARPKAAVQKLVTAIIDVLIDDPNSDCVRQDVIGSMLTIWVSLNQHLVVVRRLSGILDGRPGEAELPRQRRRQGLWRACHAVVMDSIAELVRRARMGDHHQVWQLGNDRKPRRGKRRMAIAPKARATGLPVATLDLAAAAQAETDAQFLLKLARACKSWLRVG